MFADPPEAPASDAVPARPRVARKDVLMAAGYAAAVLLLAATGARNSGFVEGWEGWPRWFSVLILLVACTSLVWRRRLPVLPLVVAGPLAAAEVIVGGQISAYLLLFEALFEPIMHGSKRLARFTTGTAISLAVLALLIAVGLGASGPNAAGRGAGRVAGGLHAAAVGLGGAPSPRRARQRRDPRCRGA